MKNKKNWGYVLLFLLLYIPITVLFFKFDLYTGVFSLIGFETGWTMLVFLAGQLLKTEENGKEKER